MSMSQKDYQAIAAILAAERELAATRPSAYAGRIDAIDHITRDLADLMAADNSRFDRGRFYAAAGLDPKFPGFPSGTFQAGS